MAVQRKKSKGNMPVDWQLVNLMDIVKINPNYKLQEQKEYDFLPMENVSEKFGGIIKYNRKIYEKQSASKFKKHDTIFAKITPCTENGKVAFIENLESEIGYGSTEFLVFSPNKKHIRPNYLFWLLGSHKIYSRAISRMEGTTGRQRVPRDVFNDLLIGLPPKHEQKQIAEILSKVDDAIEKTDAIIKETQQLKKGLMQKLFTEGIGHTRFKKTKIGRIPKEWQTAKLKEVAVFNNGANFSKHEVDNKGILMADVLNMYNEDILIDTSNFYRVNKKFSENFILEKGDILFVRSSLKREGVGLSALFDGHHEPVVFCGFLIKAKLTNSNISPKFLSYYLRAPQTRNKIISLSGTVAITNINQESLGLLDVPIPSMNEQLKITNVFSELNSKIENEQNYKSELEQLKKGLLQILLTGKVRVKV